MIRNFFTEFKEFIDKGNLLGIAIGFVLGAAFTTMINGLVENVIMPIAAIPFGEPNFDSVLVLTVNDSQIRFGAFVTTAVAFLTISFTVFLIVKAYNSLTKGEAVAPPGYIALLKELVEETRGVRADMAAREGGSADDRP